MPRFCTIAIILALNGISVAQKPVVQPTQVYVNSAYNLSTGVMSNGVMSNGPADSQAPKPQATLPQVYIDTTWNLPTGDTTWAAHTSAQLSSALTNSAPGDVIVLDAGITYVGNFKLPAKANSNSKWI